MKSTHTDITLEQMKLINNFLDNYEYALEREDLSFSEIKNLRKQKREKIFREIETQVELTGGFDVVKILEKEGSTPVYTMQDSLEEKNAILWKFKLPSFLTLFPLPSRPNIPLRYKKPVTSKGNGRIQMDPIPFTEPREVVPDPSPDPEYSKKEQVVIEKPVYIDRTEPIRPSKQYDLEVNVKHARVYVKKRNRKLVKLLNIILILDILLTIGLGVFFAYAIWSFEQGDLSWYTKHVYYNWNGGVLEPVHEYYLFNMIEITNIVEVYGIITIFSIGGYLSLYILVRFGIWIDRRLVKQKVGDLIFKCQQKVTEEELEEFGGMVKEFFFNGILSTKEDK